jgi:hypothetical protein
MFSTEVGNLYVDGSETYLNLKISSEILFSAIANMVKAWNLWL